MAVMQSTNSPNGRLINGLIIGIINGIFVIPVMMSFCSIIFRDPEFKPFMHSLVKIVLFSSAIHQLAFTYFSTMPFAVGQVQVCKYFYHDIIIEMKDAGLIFLSTMATSVASNNFSDSKYMISTALFILATSTMLLGVVLILIGRFKIANMIQYLPMPVIGGYLAFIGYFCGQAGLAMMSNLEINSISDFYLLFNIKSITLIIPGIVVGISIYLLSLTIQSPYVLPICLLTVLSVFYSIMILFGLSFDHMRDVGWIAPMAEEVAFYDTWMLYDISVVRWSLLPQQIPHLIGLFFVVSFGSSLDVAAIEMELGSPLDYNREIETVGKSNLLSGLLGGFSGSYIFSQTIFTMRRNVDTRICGYTIAIVELAVVICPISLLSYIPKFFFGSLLVLISVDLMFEWLIVCRSKMMLMEYLVCLLTFFAIQLVGIEKGMLVGVLAAMISFVISYSQLSSPTISALHQSMAVRTFEERAVLIATRGRIVTISLNGYVFFGSAIKIVDIIKQHITIDSSSHQNHHDLINKQSDNDDNCDDTSLNRPQNKRNVVATENTLSTNNVSQNEMVYQYHAVRDSDDSFAPASTSVLLTWDGVGKSYGSLSPESNSNQQEGKRGESSAYNAENIQDKTSVKPREKIFVMPSPGRIKPVLQLDVQQNEEAKMSETEYLASDSLLPTIWNSQEQLRLQRKEFFIGIQRTTSMNESTSKLSVASDLNVKHSLSSGGLEMMVSVGSCGNTSNVLSGSSLRSRSNSAISLNFPVMEESSLRERFESSDYGVYDDIEAGSVHHAMSGSERYQLQTNCNDMTSEINYNAINQAKCDSHIGNNVKTEYVILNLLHLTGIDATAARTCFFMIAQLLRDSGVTIVFTCANVEIVQILRAHKVIRVDDIVMSVIDEALEWCEEKVLCSASEVEGESVLLRHDNDHYYSHARLDRQFNHTSSPVEKLLQTNGVLNTNQHEDCSELRRIFLDYLEVESGASCPQGIQSLLTFDRLGKYFKHISYSKNTILFDIDDIADKVYFIERGSVDLMIPLADIPIAFSQHKVVDNNSNALLVESILKTSYQRVSKIGSGGIVGDSFFFLNKSYSICAVCRMDNTVLWCLDKASYGKMEKYDPSLCIILQHILLKSLSITSLNASHALNPSMVNYGNFL